MLWNDIFDGYLWVGLFMLTFGIVAPIIGIIGFRWEIDNRDRNWAKSLCVLAVFVGVVLWSAILLP
ncbi:MAG: hypothetical protein HKO95_09025 [Rhodobacteraceae bacterium]|jgi:hypothetical protein|nr:hypothetical protein [Alphaproteobacteria bacterium]NNK66868.1 hypothetical protein [Paracoccaceae bacterium]